MKQELGKSAKTEGRRVELDEVLPVTGDRG